MPCFMRVASGLAVYLASVSAIVGQEPPAQPKATVELRWLEKKHIEGLTNYDMSFPASENAGDIVYPHKKPALVLTPAEVANVRLTNSDLSKNGLSSENYMVRIQLTKKAREALAKSVAGTKTRWITVVVDGKCWNIRRYEPSDERSGSSSESTWARNFNPSIGFFSSQAEAQRIVDALK